MVVSRYPLLSFSQGRYFTTGSSTLLILPSAMAAPISTEVNDLETEFERNRDSRSAPWKYFSSRIWLSCRTTKSDDVVADKIFVQRVLLVGVGVAGRERSRGLPQGKHGSAAANPVLLDIQLVDVMEVIKIVGRDVEAVGTHRPAGWVHLVDVDGAGIDLFCFGLGNGRQLPCASIAANSTARTMICFTFMTPLSCYATAFGKIDEVARASRPRPQQFHTTAPQS